LFTFIFYTLLVMYCYAMACPAIHAQICYGIISQSYSLLTALLHSYKNCGYLILFLLI